MNTEKSKVIFDFVGKSSFLCFLGGNAKFMLHFCAAERTLERLPADTQRQQRTGLIDHFPFNHDIIMLSYALEHRVG